MIKKMVCKDIQRWNVIFLYAEWDTDQNTITLIGKNGSTLQLSADMVSKYIPHFENGNGEFEELSPFLYNMEDHVL